ncbi:MAG: TatD family hydrolase [Solitalea-like symbiont of Tyrophagus putrescentiae]
MVLTDTHTHLYCHNEGLEGQLNRAISGGVKRLFMPNIDSATIAPMLDISRQYPNNCFPMLGLHPASVNNNYRAELEKIKSAFTPLNKICGVGEIGLDYFHSKEFVNEQKEAFIEQISWAKQYNLPIVIHLRNAYKDFIDIVRKYFPNPINAVVHCFSGDVSQAEELVSLGFFLGIGGILTYKNSTLRDVLQYVPIENIVIETDAPFLAPVPFRGKQNESSYILYTAAQLAKVYNVTMSDIALITTENSKRLFLK